MESGADSDMWKVNICIAKVMRMPSLASSWGGGGGGGGGRGAATPIQ